MPRRLALAVAALALSLAACTSPTAPASASAPTVNRACLDDGHTQGSGTRC